MGCNGFDAAFEDLVGLVESLGLQDLPLHGLFFIFFSSGPSSSQSHLDRFFIFCEARGWSHSVKWRAVFRLILDHIPIFISNGQLSSGPRPFRVFNIWCSNNDPQSLVSTVWQEMDHNSHFLWCTFD